tara:strand:+ start:448 stop:639 length:192 start_codon:yes stop_codon:yes gene_type:complete
VELATSSTALAIACGLVVDIARAYAAVRPAMAGIETVKKYKTIIVSLIFKILLKEGAPLPGPL